MQQATLELLHFLLFLSTASSHPPSLPLQEKKVPPGFLALKGQKKTGSWQPPIPWALVTDGGRREDRTGEGKGVRGGGGPRKKREGGRQGKVLCGTFLKPALTTAAAEDGLRYVHLREETRQADRKIMFEGDRQKKHKENGELQVDTSKDRGLKRATDKMINEEV